MAVDDSNSKSAIEGTPLWARLLAVIRANASALLGWACLIFASLITFWLAQGTRYHQISAGLLLSSSTLFILVALFECLWRLFVDQDA